jgi:SHS2 domain-containing protein
LPYTVLSHTADTGIEAVADTLADLIRFLALGMFEIMAHVEPCPPDHVAEVELRANTREDLVVDALAELLYRSEVDDLVFCDFEVETAGQSGVRVRATGVPVGDVELAGPPIKAVTYHDVVVTETDEGWYGRVYFDV